MDSLLVILAYYYWHLLLRMNYAFNPCQIFMAHASPHELHVNNPCLVFMDHASLHGMHDSDVNFLNSRRAPTPSSSYLVIIRPVGLYFAMNISAYYDAALANSIHTFKYLIINL